MGKDRYQAIPWRSVSHIVGGPELARIYAYLEADGTLKTVFHERHYSLEDFIAFFTHPGNIALIFWDWELSLCPGVAWATDIARTDCGIRASAGFAFFKRFQTREVTLPLGIAGLRYFFEAAGIRLVFGITPRPNRASRLYSKALGMDYCAEAPGFTCFNGKPADALFCIMTQEKFFEMHGHSERQDPGSMDRNPGIEEKVVA